MDLNSNSLLGFSPEACVKSKIVHRGRLYLGFRFKDAYIQVRRGIFGRSILELVLGDTNKDPEEMSKLMKSSIAVEKLQRSNPFEFRMTDFHTDINEFLAPIPIVNSMSRVVKSTSEEAMSANSKSFTQVLDEVEYLMDFVNELMLGYAGQRGV